MKKNNKVEPKLEPKFKVVMQVNDKEFVAFGDTVLEAIEKIEIGFIKTRLVVFVYSEDKSSSMIFYVARAKRLFTNKVFRECMANWLERILK